MIYSFKAKKGDELAGIGLYRLHDKIIWYGVVIYAYPHFGIFEIEKIRVFISLDKFLEGEV